MSDDRPRYEITGIKFTDEEVISALKIKEIISIAKEAALFTSFGPLASGEAIKNYYKAAFESLAEANIQQALWWNNLRNKYPGLPQDTTLELSDLKLYTYTNVTQDSGTN
jgi:hypothetical protein